MVELLPLHVYPPTLTLFIRNFWQWLIYFILGSKYCPLFVKCNAPLPQAFKKDSYGNLHTCRNAYGGTKGMT